jgi:hypothetical protein
MRLLRSPNDHLDTVSITVDAGAERLVRRAEAAVLAITLALAGVEVGRIAVLYSALALIGPAWSFMLAMLATSSLIVLRPRWPLAMLGVCVAAPYRRRLSTPNSWPRTASWHERVHEIWIRHLDAPPAVDVCSYNNEDLDALGLTIDQLATALELIAHHDHVIVLDGDTTTTNAPAIRRILRHARPIGTSTEAWQTLTAAAAQTLATAKPS